MVRWRIEDFVGRDFCESPREKLHTKETAWLTSAGCTTPHGLTKLGMDRGTLIGSPIIQNRVRKWLVRQKDISANGKQPCNRVARFGMTNWINIIHHSEQERESLMKCIVPLAMYSIARPKKRGRMQNSTPFTFGLIIPPLSQFMWYKLKIKIVFYWNSC